MNLDNLENLELNPVEYSEILKMKEEVEKNLDLYIYSLEEVIYAIWDQDNKWYPGCIKKINSDGTYCVYFDDGDKQEFTKIQNIKNSINDIKDEIIIDYNKNKDTVKTTQTKNIQDQEISIECPICFEFLDSLLDIAVLECKHKYHLNCLSSWYARPKSSYKCPLCYVTRDIVKIIPKKLELSKKNENNNNWSNLKKSGDIKPKITKPIYKRIHKRLKPNECVIT